MLAAARVEIVGSENAAAKLNELARFTHPRLRATSYAPVCTRSKSSSMVSAFEIVATPRMRFAAQRLPAVSKTHAVVGSATMKELL